MLTIPTIYKSFFGILFLSIWIVACQTDVADNQQKDSAQAQLQARLDSVSKELDSIKKANQTAVVERKSKEKKKPSSAPKISKKDTKRNTALPKVQPTITRREPPTTKVEPTIISPTIPSNRDRSTELKELKAAIGQEQQEMLQAKEAAQSADAPSFASITYEEALAKEQTAQQKVQQGNSTTLKEAKADFTAARSLFQRATEETEQLLAAQAEADEAETAMLSMRRNIGNGSRNPSTLSSYKEAIVMERRGKEAYDANQFEEATKAYEQAEVLYRTAKEAIARQVKQQENNQEQNTGKVEERKIQIIIDNYGQLLEVGDIQGLLQERYITPKERGGWGTLFKNVENITIKISDKSIKVKGRKATADFSVKMFYQNKTNNKIEENKFLKSWQLEQRNDKWFIVNR